MIRTCGCKFAVLDENILWRVNFEEFNRALRHQACVDIVESKLDRHAGFALKCMLEATRASECKVLPRCFNLNQDPLTST